MIKNTHKLFVITNRKTAFVVIKCNVVIIDKEFTVKYLNPQVFLSNYLLNVFSSLVILISKLIGEMKLLFLKVNFPLLDL